MRFFTLVKKDILNVVRNKVDYCVKKHLHSIKKMKGEFLRFLPVEIFTSHETRINYCICPFTYGWKDYKKNTLGMLTFAYFYKDYGQYVLCLRDAYPSNYVVYTPHFFDRYQERFLQDPTLDRISVMTKYFRSNRANFINVVPDDKRGKTIYAVTMDGVCFADDNLNGNYIMKTFVTYEMLFTNQVDIGEEGKEAILKNYEEFKNNVK